MKLGESTSSISLLMTMFESETTAKGMMGFCRQVRTNYFHPALFKGKYTTETLCGVLWDVPVASQYRDTLVIGIVALDIGNLALIAK